MSKKHLSILIASLFAAAPVFAQDPDPFLSTGQITAGGIWTDSSTNDASKFQEYQDLSNGMLSNIGIQGRNARSWINAYGENFGRDDMYVNIRGGMYDMFKAQAYTNWIPHNLLFNGRTPFTGSGGPTLTATFPNNDPNFWQNVDIGYERKDTGGYFEWQSLSPWYFRVDGNQVKFNGTKLGAGSNGTSPGNGFTDLAIPVDFETNNAAFEMGYTTRALTVTGSYMVSNFNNGNETVSWNNPFWGNGVDRTTLPPSNQYQRFLLNATWRQLPWNSTLAARYTWDETTDDVNIMSQVLNGVNVILPVQPSTNTFSGDEKRQTFTLGWAASPVETVDTKVYYNWQKMNNDGTEVTFCASGSSSCGGTFENELWNYEKQNAGIDAYWKLNRANRIGGGYDWYNITQNRVDFDDTTTNTIWVEWKNTSLATLASRIKYSYLKRHSNFLLGNAGVDANDPAYINRYVKPFDLANVDQNRVKWNIDWAPSDNVGVGFEYLFKNNDYNDTQLGRQNDKRNEFFVNLTYGNASSWRVSLFGDYEDIRYNGYHRFISTSPCNASTGPNCFDINTAPNASAYNWGETVKNSNWIVGLGADWPVTDKFSLSGSFLYQQTDGAADLSVQQAGSFPPPTFVQPINLTQYPDIKTTTLNIKGTYKFDKNWSGTLGYAYQKYDYNDDEFNGYTYIIVPGASQSYANGWNAFNSYNANIVYATVKFTWDPPELAPPPMKVAEAPPPPRPAAAPPAPPPPAPAPAPAPAPGVQKITLDSKALFDFDKAVLKPEGKAAIDSQVIGRLASMQKLEVVLVTGHTDRLGSDAYNQKLSLRRADAVRDYLVSKGVDKAKIETIGMGEKQPVVQCDQKNRAELIACLQPNRRVEVQAKGESTK